MGVTEIKPGEKIHNAGDTVDTIDIIIKGSVQMTLPHHEGSVSLGVGSVIGLCECPGDSHRFTYTSPSGASVFSYPFTKMDDVGKVITANAKIAPTITSAVVAEANRLREYSIHYEKSAVDAYNKVREEQKEMQKLAAALGKMMPNYSNLADLQLPEEGDSIDSWRENFAKAFMTYDASLKKDLYVLGVDICIGVIYTVTDYMRRIMGIIDQTTQYNRYLHEETIDFHSGLEGLRIESREQTRQLTGGDETAVPEMKNVLNVILNYSGADDVIKTNMRNAIEDYVALKDRSSTDEDARRVRRKLVDPFFKIYEECLFKSFISPGRPPIEVGLFLRFCYMDERLVTKEDFDQLYRIYVNYIPDPYGRVVTIEEWLRKIYDGKVMPSKNEFDLDYPSYLKEAVRQGDMTESHAERMLSDFDERTRFEIRNLFTGGNRMTFGRISVYVPIFDSVNQMMPLDKCYVSAERVDEALAAIREYDHRIFFREEICRFDDDATPVTVHKEFLPYVLLMPNIGSRTVLWQEIEGKKRTTPGRMLVPIFCLEDFQLSIARLCGEFRWEMCKTDQGVHWNDLSDPSLTAEYSDYLQYYRKNSSLSPEHREKIKKALQKAGNNYRRVFVADYVLYIMYEAKGVMRLNKVARDIIYRYCPLALDHSEGITVNAQYAQLLERQKNHNAQGARPLSNLIKKREASELDVPEELYEEVKYLSK
ncbi:MAG: hypothetical protein K6B14_03390 [Lachnospiraceae bacterium]|nr:hypothetical protein [Lachnospiraceae bacterium]